jgi:hypothetical protein
MSSDDIVARLRNYRRLEFFPPICSEAADEIERLRKGGCARDQNTTQFCAEAAYLADQLQTSRERNRELIMRNGELEAEARNLRALLYERLP